MEESQLIVGSSSDPGTVRERNEDLVYHAELPSGTTDHAFLLAVADGMGGYERGDVAARMAIDALIERFNNMDSDDTVEILTQAYRQANETIHADGSAQGEENMMGTTLVSGVVLGTDLTIANVGDSRAYLVRAGAMTQVTNDHSLIAEQVRMGVISAEEAKESQHRNIITRALGHRPKIDVDVFELTLLPEDRLLLSTDGLHEFVEEPEIQRILESSTPEDAARELISRALANGSTDNATALCAWMAPVSSLVAAEAGEEAEAQPSSYLVPAIVLVGLVIFIAIVVLIITMI